MLGSADPDGTAFQRRTGGSGVYVVTAEPDALHARAIAAGAVEVMPLTDTEYGSRTFTVADPEGNLWSFGTYAGEPPS